MIGVEVNACRTLFSESSGHIVRKAPIWMSKCASYRRSYAIELNQAYFETSKVILEAMVGWQASAGGIAF